MKSKITTPYTYLIGWSHLNLWYYGVRYARGCNPVDLWNPYKTSSKYVSIAVEKYGKPSIIQVRKIFKNSLSARKWENTVLRRMSVVEDEKWLNKHNSISIDPACIPRGNDHWTRKNADVSLQMKLKNHPIYSAESREKIKGNNHYTRQPEYDNSNHPMKRPDVIDSMKIKVSGDNHYTHKIDYDNSNHYAKRPEARLKRAARNKEFFTGFKHKLKKCAVCNKEIPSNNYPQHIRKCDTVLTLI